MPKILKIDAPALGADVELREQTVGEWLQSQEQMERERAAGGDDSQAGGSMRMLADVLYIDGQKVGWERLKTFGIFEVQPAMSQLNALLGGAPASDDQGNA